MEYTILIADDEKEIRDLLRLYLENEHYQVLEAQDGMQALELVHNNRVDMCILEAGRLSCIAGDSQGK